MKIIVLINKLFLDILNFYIIFYFKINLYFIKIKNNI